jgi:hypothetical protein
MNNLHIRQMLSPPLGDEAAVAVVRDGFGAEETWMAIESQKLSANGLGIAFDQKGEKGGLVRQPVAVGPVVVEDLGGRGQFGTVLVFDAKSLSQQESQVVALGESGQLGSVAQADVNDSVDASFLKEVDELLQRLLGVSDRVDAWHWPLE